MERLRTYKFPLVLALCAMLANVLMGIVPAVAAPVKSPDAGQELSLAEALMVVCTSDGAKSQGNVSHDNCNHCTTCAHVSAKAPLLPLLAVAYPVAAADVWRYRDQSETPADPTPHARPFSHGPPVLSPTQI